MTINTVQPRKPFSSASSIVGTVAVVTFLGVYWLFGWGYPSRAEMEGFLHYALARDGTITVFRDDGAEQVIDGTGMDAIEDVVCHSERRRHQPSILYYCLYTLRGTSGQVYRAVVAANHNRGWKRLGMADIGNYRLVYLSPAVQREIFARYDQQLPEAQSDAKQGKT